MRNFSIVNGMRGVAALWVVLGHCSIWIGYHSILPDPKIAVDIFMLISGFVMMYTSHVVYPQLIHSDKYWRIFYIRRFFRLSPAYYLVLLLAFMLSHYFESGYHQLGLMQNNSYLANYPADFSWNNFFLHISYIFGLLPESSSSTLLSDWSIGVEAQFYLIFPFLYIFLTRRQNWLSLSCICLFSIILSLATRKYVLLHYIEPSLLSYQLPVFLLGCLIYCGIYLAQSKWYKVSVVVMIIILCCYIIIVKYQGKKGYELFFVIMLISYSCSNSKLAIMLENFFDNRLFKILANLSYGVYLIHDLILAVLGSLIVSKLLHMGFLREQFFLPLSICIVVISYFFAAIIYLFVEQPGIKLGRRLVESSYKRKLN